MKHRDPEDQEPRESKIVELPSKRQPSQAQLARLQELRQVLETIEPPNPNELSDERVIQDENAFRRRFGPGFSWPKRQRAALIRLKEECDLTDAEIRLLRWSGDLKRTATGITLQSSVWSAFSGGVILSYIGALIVGALILTVVGIFHDASITVRGMLVLMILGGICVGLYYLHVFPWRTQHRVERQPKRRD